MDNVLSIVANNKALFDALKDVMKKQFDLDQIALEQSNEEMGQVVRARLVGLIKVEQGFRAIEQFKTEKESRVEPNPAR